MTATVLRSDARALPLPDASVDLIVTSPPYFALRSYTDGGEHYAGQIGAEPTPAEYIASLIACTREWVRVLKPSGSLFVNLGDKYNGSGGTSGHSGANGTGQRTERRSNAKSMAIAVKSLMMLPERYRIAAVDELGLIARAVLVWSKPNGLPESVTDRVRRSHEDWVHLTKLPRYFSAVDEIREQHAASSQARAGTPRKVSPKDGIRKNNNPIGLSTEKPGTIIYDSYANPLGKLPGSVWEIATEPLKVPEHLGVDHFAAFPTEWPRRIISAWSPAGGTVLDPFGGTGTTALVASVLGRHGISVDMSADYCRLARWRTQDPCQRAKAARVPAPPKVHHDQGDLLGEWVSRP